VKAGKSKKELTEIKKNNSISSKNVATVSYKAVNEVDCESLEKKKKKLGGEGKRRGLVFKTKKRKKTKQG
jgi:hypothetical protein